jgi:AcrR family transcriptional regulator
VLSTKDQLMRAGEKLFARRGIHGVTVRQLNEAAGQRNTTAIHYHFSSRDGLVRAIVDHHQAEVDAERRRRLDALAPDPDVRALVALVLEPLAEKLHTTRGRDYLRIVPQLLDMPGLLPPALGEVTALLEQRLDRPDRLVPMLLATTTLLADRARRSGPHDAFVVDLVSMATGMLLAEG